MSSQSNVPQIYEAVYSVHQYFEIPDNIDLKNRSQVKNYNVMNGKLIIELIDGTKIKISGTNYDDCDFKYPEEEFIIDDEDWAKNIAIIYFGYDD